MKASDGTETRSPDVSEIDAEVLAYWTERSKATPHPVLRARYADLVWDFQHLITQSKPDVQFARIAIDSYVEIIDRELYSEPVIGIRNAERALELAIRIGDKERIEQVRDTMFRLYKQVAKPSLAGTWPFLFDSLYNNKKVPLAEGQEQRIIDSLEEILRQCGDEANQDEFSPNAARDAGERLAAHYQRVGKRADVERVVGAYGAAFERISAKADGLLGMTWLQSLFEDYRRHGMIGDAERVQLAGTEKGKQASGEMKSVAVNFTIEAEKLEAYFEAMSEGSVAETLGRIAVHFIPKVNDEREALKKIERDHPFMALVGVQRIGQGHISARIGSVEEDPDGRLYSQLAQSIGFRAPFLRGSIDRARKRHGVGENQIVDFLYQSPLFETGRRSLLRRGIEAYLGEDYVTAIHVLVPQIEHALRVLLGLLGVPTNKAYRGVMQVKNLNDILREPAIKAALGEDTQFYLIVFLADPRGYNVRNDACHGLLEADAFRPDVADRVVHCLLTLGLVRKSEEPKA